VPDLFQVPPFLFPLPSIRSSSAENSLGAFLSAQLFVWASVTQGKRPGVRIHIRSTGPPRSAQIVGFHQKEGDVTMTEASSFQQVTQVLTPYATLTYR